MPQHLPYAWEIHDKATEPDENGDYLYEVKITDPSLEDESTEPDPDRMAATSQEMRDQGVFDNLPAGEPDALIPVWFLPLLVWIIRFRFRPY